MAMVYALRQLINEFTVWCFIWFNFTNPGGGRRLEWNQPPWAPLEKRLL